MVGKAQSPRQRRNRRAEAIRKRAEDAAPKLKATHNTTRSARPQIIAAALRLAGTKGYEPLSVKDIISEVGISHQAFYGHFANKRHVVAIATSEDLGAVVDLAMRNQRRDQVWAGRLLDDIDAALAESYPARRGPEQRLRRRLLKAISSEGGYGSLRIAELIKISRLGQGEFYRRYGGKKGCLQRLYAETVEEIRAELGEAGEKDPLIALAEVLAADSKRARFLIVGASYLPEGSAGEEGNASRQSFGELVGSLVDATGEESRNGREATTGALVELIRSAVLAEEASELPGRLDAFRVARSGRGPRDQGAELLAA